MRKTFALGLLGISFLAGNAQTFKEWQDPEINAINRAPMHTDYFAYESAEAIGNGKMQSQNYMEILLGGKCRPAPYRFLENRIQRQGMG